MDWQCENISPVWLSAQLVTDSDWEANTIQKQWFLQLTSLSDWYSQMGYKPRYDYVFCIGGGQNSQRGIFETLSQGTASCIYFVLCQLCLHFNYEILGQDYSWVCVQGSYGQSELSTLQIMFTHKQWSVYCITSPSSMMEQYLNFRWNLRIIFQSIMPYHS